MSSQYKEELPSRLEYTTHALETTAMNISIRLIPDAKVRMNYSRAVESSAKEIIAAYHKGEYSLEQAAEVASDMRNQIMNMARTRTSQLGNALAKDMKYEGLSLSKLQSKYARKFFARGFHSLSQSEQGKVHYEIVLKSGQSNKFVTGIYKKLQPACKALLILSISVVVYDVLTAKNKTNAAVYHGAILGSGIAGGAATGAASGVICGPGAPVCVSLGVFIGGIMGAAGMQYALGRTAISHY